MEILTFTFMIFCINNLTGEQLRIRGGVMKMRSKTDSRPGCYAFFFVCNFDCRSPIGLPNPTMHF